MHLNSSFKFNTTEFISPFSFVTLFSNSEELDSYYLQYTYLIKPSECNKFPLLSSPLRGNPTNPTQVPIFVSG